MSKTADDMGVHDHGSIVWDEFVGVFIVLASIPTLSLPWIVIAFVLFRFFDILNLIHPLILTKTGKWFWDYGG